MRSVFPSCVLVFGTLLPAQDPSPAPVHAELAAAKARLTQALQKTAGRPDTAFTAQWGPDGKGGEMMDALGPMGRDPGKATGSWHQDRLHVAFDGDHGDELVLAGRRTIARDANSEWKVRSGRFADGNTIPFVPDAALLLQELAGEELAVAHRTVGTLDDRPVEILTLTLAPEQVGEVLWAGALPPAAMGTNLGLLMLMGGNAQRRAAPLPDATVDLVAYVDPATDVVHKLHFRIWSKAMVGRGRQAVFVQGGVARVQFGGGGDDTDDEEVAPAKDAPPTDGSVRDEHHLPVRSRKNTMVADYTVRFTDHGSKAAPPLNDQQKRLLGL